MNLVLLQPEDGQPDGTALITGRRFRHVMDVHRVAPGDERVVGLLGGRLGRGRVLEVGDEALRLAVSLEAEPPPKLPLVLVLALPRPKVLNRVLASATSLGVQSIHLVNAWKVEKSYWKSPRMDPANLLLQRLLGLEQARDTILPDLHVHRLFRPFLEDVLPGLLAGRRGHVAHPGVGGPRALRGSDPLLVAVGPEGGWIEDEVAALVRAGLAPLDLGPRILRVETAVAFLAGALA